MPAKTETQERDHIDRFLDSIRERLPMLDPEVEGIVDRIGGLDRRFKRAMDETLGEFNLDYAEYKLLGLLSREGGARERATQLHPSSQPRTRFVLVRGISSLQGVSRA